MTDKRLQVLVTGASGFIGTHVVHMLEGAMDVFKADVRSGLNIFDINDLLGIDVVVHLAAYTNVQHSFVDRYSYYWNNAMGTAHMLERCVKDRVRMIYISSAATADPDSSPYAYSKWMAECLVESMIEAVRGVILVPENVYGVGMNKSALFARFLEEKELHINGRGTHTRDFVNVTDIARIVRFAIERNWSNVVLPVGSGKETSVKEVAQIFQKYTGKKIVYDPKVKEIAHSKADITKLLSMYPLEMVTDLEKDIKDMVAKYN